jgi:hypothetical protein
MRAPYFYSAQRRATVSPDASGANVLYNRLQSPDGFFPSEAIFQSYFKDSR